MKLACFDSDRIRKIDFDNEGNGTAYTTSGEAYERILKRLADAEVDPIVPISDEWLPEGAGAWPLIDGNPEKDHPDNNYNCQPFWYENWSNNDQLCWRQASMELNKALRHPSKDPSYLCLPLHENGWANTLDCIRFLRPKVSRFVGIPKSVVDRICSYNWLLGVTLCDQKHRYSLAGATDSNGILEEGSNIFSFGFIRAKSGHSGYVAEMVNRSAYSWISPIFAKRISCICHKTQRQYVREIFYNGLMPGKMIRAGDRVHVNLSPFLPHDTRNTAVGRTHDSYDTVIMFNKDRVLNEHEMLMPANGIVATTGVLFNDLIQLIYVVPSGQYDRRCVLYDPDLWDLVPCGYTNTGMSQSYFKDTSWEAQLIVANDSYACPNPHCGLFNPKGFTACVTCGCKFTFEAVIGPSKVARPGSVNDEAEVTAKEIEDYGLRIAKHSVRAKEKRVYVYKDNFLLWKQVVRCLGWRRKWDFIWTEEDNLNKLQKGGSRWHSGEQWDRPSQKDFNQMRRNYPSGTPGSEEFYAKHHDSICDGDLLNHKHMATVHVWQLVR